MIRCYLNLYKLKYHNTIIIATMAATFDIFMVRDILVSILLLAASYMDLRTREISDIIWILMLLIGLPVTIYQLIAEFHYLTALLYVISLSIALVFSLTLGYFGFFGGADAKAFIALGLIELPRLTASSYVIPSLSIIVNSYVLSMLTILLLAIRNVLLYAKDRDIFREYEGNALLKITILITSCRIRVGDLLNNPFFYFPSEIRSSKKRRLILSCRVKGDSYFIGKYSPNDYIWAAPTIPLIVFIAFGFITYRLYGNIVLKLLSLSLG